ncbi:hypothetical protein RI129_007870 [Pyrocoelia pectoralis]|uniref:Cytochrome P450 n=1 Tax=Pyrocoelia pectoralis TaxID=417401 RepID=A0AAN7V944_9COLE
MWVLILILVICILLAVIFKLRKIYSYWKDRGVDYVSPLYSFGLLTENSLRVNSYAKVFENAYETFPDRRYIGMYNLFQPVLLIRDLELVKRICVKDNDSFQAHSEVIPLEIDDMWSKNIYAVENAQQWYKIRTVLTPFFTSNKIRTSFPVIQKFSTNFTDYLKSESAGEKITLEMYKVIRRLLNDITVNTYFGVSCDSLKQPNNIVIMMVGEAMNLPGFQRFFQWFGRFSPQILQLFGIKVFNSRVKKFFTDIMEESLKLGFKHGFNRHDIIGTLFKLYASEIPVQNTLNKTIVEDITSQAFLLLFSGYETVVSTLTLMIYELTVNSDVQEKLFEEITQTLEKYDGIISYESIMAMEYLDQTLNETLRLHPPSALIDRQATEDYVIEAENPNEKDLLIEKGTPIWILQNAIQTDADNFPNPKKFDPDRFMIKNKLNMKSYSYIPFGAGPRSCLGYRYGLMQVKLIITSLLLNFELLPTTKTYVQDSSNTCTVREHGVWVELNPRLR